MAEILTHLHRIILSPKGWDYQVLKKSVHVYAFKYITKQNSQQRAAQNDKFGQHYLRNYSRKIIHTLNHTIELYTKKIALLSSQIVANKNSDDASFILLFLTEASTLLTYDIAELHLRLKKELDAINSLRLNT